MNTKGASPPVGSAAPGGEARPEETGARAPVIIIIIIIIIMIMIMIMTIIMIITIIKIILIIDSSDNNDNSSSSSFTSRLGPAHMMTPRHFRVVSKIGTQSLG